ncbi:MAG: ATP-binding cassette domain-containing protein [Gammaproteobacteria bacterium]|uniref:ATP-binding cassette domain-containing protein n=1 Tax=Rhodoferax sp. TaxID=50421 RepID=UPI0017F96EB4|nr:ATP-binding cassette domain-containing protein [Rhodoferax sp.]MBU3897697.1 ATP-binding cassette domain-containing protein [Gammaproteobacteria bacterium]MBA3057789.1 ATP-binding cassette domain-containing protein [Rhodoferax sp.]MBU3998808.1 ATP-binding cassette domain-containing protein [Gammaproteobacteria bacterium]MBU4081540.1 ATP-binding cassette domain-containing protein [Gammaproteobacteria bacterium]MBU4114057.1 ATP-binding cassette domain-containing protein [Gammaproteobacteria ba
MNKDIATLIDKCARLAGQRVAGGRLSDLGHLTAGLGATALFREAWRAAGLHGDPARLVDPTPAHLPLAGWRPDLGWLLVQGRGADGQWRAEQLDGTFVPLQRLDDVECLSLPRRDDTATTAPRAIGLVWQALLARKRVFLEAVLATGLVNLLTLATSIYSMQVYDRVIPNQGFQTLWVLSVGVALAVGLELLLKQVRSHTVDRACNAIDQQLSEWFFSRMMGIRMEARPASVGTLASQVKGFEMVRGVLASTSLFVLADVPFALFFILVIGLVGGWVVAVPLIALPIALAAGLMFQRAIQRHTRLNLAGNNRKAGLLVEAVDGAESLKANSAEWRLQARWNRLVAETAESDQRIRTYSALAQNLTVALQQLGYVALVALGAYFVTLNELTMGGLLACTIISNRAMMPIVQLPGVMVQWAHARAAVEGLDQIIALPSEADDAPHALAPQTLAGGLRLERVRFAYGLAPRPALEIERLEIKAGERVGLLGAIGSGKSTLLKLCSGLYRPTEGKLFLGGLDVALLTQAVAREALGYLPQDARLFSGTLRDNLLLGLPDPGDESILLAAQRTGLIELIGAQPKGLALEITEGGRGVSGGQKQLIMLTRTLLASPRVWLLDEPTGAMDSMTEARVVSLLREITGAGATLVAATHKTALLPLFDRLIVLQNGRILLDGPRDAVLAKLSGRPQSAAQEKLA